jgi:hypothetical protein
MLLGILAAVLAPLFLVYILIAADIRQDLSDIRPRPQAVLGAAPVVGWNALAVQDGDKPGDVLQRGPRSGDPVAMLGYQMDGSVPVRDHTLVSAFTLMPDAGTWVHPAHREADEMVAVTLRGNSRTPFIFRRLVWVTGRFQHLAAKPRYGEPLYGITAAAVADASEKNLARWFVPYP